MSGIYVIINLLNGMIYVGSAINFKKRWKEHCNLMFAGKHPNIKIQRVFDKYGLEIFQFTIVEVVKDQSKLLKIEQLWIDASNCCNREVGYNLCPTAGSNLGRRWSEETKLKLSIAGKNRKLSETHKLRIGNANKGKKRTPEMIKLMSERMKGNKISEETRAKLIAARLGKKRGLYYQSSTVT